MKKENMKIKEIITFEDKANAIEYICNSLFDFGEMVKLQTTPLIILNQRRFVLL